MREALLAAGYLQLEEAGAPIEILTSPRHLPAQGLAGEVCRRLLLGQKTTV